MSSKTKSEYKSAIQSYKPSLPFAVYFSDTSHNITYKNLLCVVWVCQVLRKKEKKQKNIPSTLQNLIAEGTSN